VKSKSRGAIISLEIKLKGVRVLKPNKKGEVKAKSLEMFVKLLGRLE